jgi:hypothetical protein
MSRRSFIGRLGVLPAALLLKLELPPKNRLLTERRIYADDYLGVASDFGGVVNYILKEVGKRAATIVIPDRSIQFATPIDLIDSRAIRITGEGIGNPNSVTDWGPNLIWTGGAGSGSAVKANGSVALEWDHINLSYNHAAYDGNLFSLGRGGLQATSTPHVHHCRISGTPSAKRAARLIELNVTLALSMEHVTMDYAVVGVGCSGGANSSITIGEGCWLDKHFSDCAIKGWGHTWTIGPVVHECDPDDGVALTPLFKLAGDTTALAFRSCWSGDGGNGGGTIIDLDTGGFTVQGVELQSVLGAHVSGTFLRCSDTAGKTTGLSMRGCRIDSKGAGALGVHLGKSDGVAIHGNRIAYTTPWTGSAPTRYSVGNNDYGGNDAACGVPVAQDADIAITPPGSENGGLGIVDILNKEDPSHARFALNGAAGTTTEIYDPSTRYTNTKDVRTMSNVYYDARTRSYRLQNKRGGGTRTYIVTYSGR